MQQQVFPINIDRSNASVPEYNSEGYLNTTTLDESDLYYLVTVSADVFDRPKTMFLDWTDLDASFTDFIIVTRIEEEGVEYIATDNRHHNAFDVTTVPYHHS